MAHPTITPAEFAAIEGANRKKVEREQLPGKVVEKIVTVTKEVFHGFAGSFTLALFVVIYFTFTGLAILFNRKMPKEWLDLMKTPRVKGLVGKVRKETAEIAPIEEVVQAKKPKASYKVVDLETGSHISA